MGMAFFPFTIVAVLASLVVAYRALQYIKDTRSWIIGCSITIFLLPFAFYWSRFYHHLTLEKKMSYLFYHSMVNLCLFTMFVMLIVYGLHIAKHENKKVYFYLILFTAIFISTPNILEYIMILLS